jgi:LPS sulfotransferase NodH
MTDHPVENAVHRVDAFDLMSERFDTQTPEPVTRKLIVCAAPRSGTYRLSRLLHAADLGAPLEYFNPRFMPAFCRRWGVPLGDNGQPNMDEYMKALMQRRVHRGLFCAKLQFWQFGRTLRNETGRALFERAVVVHLMRGDVQMQSISLHAALATGRWEFTDRPMIEPQFPASALTDPQRVAQAIKLIVAEDAGWRSLFGFSGIVPLLITLDDLVERAEDTVGRIAERVGLSFDRQRLIEMIAVDKKYQTNAAEIAQVQNAVASALGRLAFQPPQSKSG